jgi:acyl carrier protein
MTTVETIRQYILDSFLSDEDEISFRNDEDLLKVLNSLQILRTIIELERLFDLKVDNSELTPENLGTVERLADFVDRKHCQQA